MTHTLTLVDVRSAMACIVKACIPDTPIPFILQGVCEITSIPRSQKNTEIGRKRTPKRVIGDGAAYRLRIHFLIDAAIEGRRGCQTVLLVKCLSDVVRNGRVSAGLRASQKGRIGSVESQSH